MSGAFLIETNQLRKVYGTDVSETVALNDVTLQVSRGEFLAVMGPSGSGKSTLIQILGLLDRQTSGTYLFDGIASDKYSEQELARLRNHKIGFVFQAFNLLPKTSVYENVMLPLTYSEVPTSEWSDRVMQTIEKVGLTHRSDHESGMLSGGEKQRCAIARSLVLSPSIIFADEPTGNLDSKSGEGVMSILRDLHRAGHTIVLITHDRHIAGYAQRIVTMKDGHLVEDERI